ncbi:MAG: DUF192 domain-containing protein [bacterium]
MRALQLGLIWALVFSASAGAAELVKLRLNKAVIYAEVANDRKSRTKGLGYRDRLKEGRGMLFIFERPGKYPFYMKGMRFAIDIIWIFRNKVVEVTASIPPPRNPSDRLPLYYPPAPVDMVLELNSGVAGKIGLKKGNDVNLEGER